MNIITGKVPDTVKEAAKAQPKDKKSSTNIRVVGDTIELEYELRLKVAKAKTPKELKEIANTVSHLKSDAEAVWDAADSKECLESIKAQTPVELSAVNTPFSLGVEGSIFYIPKMHAYGTVDVRVALNDWKTKLMDIQARIRSRINSVSVDADNNITDIEMKNSNAYNDIIFFISHDAKLEGDALMKKAQTTKDIDGMLESIEDLSYKLEGFKPMPENTQTIINVPMTNLSRWSLILASIATILRERKNSMTIPQGVEK